MGGLPGSLPRPYVSSIVIAARPMKRGPHSTKHDGCHEPCRAAMTVRQTMGKAGTRRAVVTGLTVTSTSHSGPSPSLGMTLTVLRVGGAGQRRSWALPHPES